MKRILLISLLFLSITGCADTDAFFWSHKKPSIYGKIAQTGLTKELVPPKSAEQFMYLNATGTATYQCRGDWVLMTTDATMQDFKNVQLATLYYGPTFEGSDGSRITAKVRFSEKHVQPDGSPTMPLELLRATTAHNPGMFDDVTYIQRLNTRGGLVEKACVNIGEEVKVPFSALYVFYR